MPEVIKFEFNASADAFIGEVDAVREVTDGLGVTQIVPLAGVAMPGRQMSMAQLKKRNPKLHDDLRSVLDRLEPVLRNDADDDAKDPEKIRGEANRVARDRQALAAEQAAHKAGLIARAEELARLEDEKKASDAAAKAADEQAVEALKRLNEINAQIAEAEAKAAETKESE